jgi:hypothetical protein
MILKTIIPQDMTQKEIKYVIDAMVISDGAEYIQVSLVNGRDYLLETSRKRDYIKELNVEHEIPG